MTFRIFEVPEFAETTGNPPSETHTWKAIGSSDPVFVNIRALAATPRVITSAYGLLYRQDLKLSQTAYNHFDVVIPYGPSSREVGDWSWDFDTTGGTVHISTAKEEVGRFPKGEAPDQKGVINFDGENVVGTDVVIPAMKINVQYKHPEGDITLAQAKFLSDITGTVSSTRFLTFAPGEVLFLGARGGDGTTAETTVSYDFAMSSNADALPIGDIANIVKKGWHTAWIRYEDRVETEDDVDHPVRAPKYVYVDRVYDEIDMALALGFGAS